MPASTSCLWSIASLWPISRASAVVGISKLSRLIRLMARRPVLREDPTHELAELLYKRLDRGLGGLCRGPAHVHGGPWVEAHEARLVTSAMRGIFVDQLPTRQEFLDLVTAAPLQLL